MKATDTFKDNVKQAWGDPLRVARIAFDELFRHEDMIDLDHDDQVNYAVRIGVLAGEHKDSDPGTFIQQFEDEILSGE